MPEAEMNSTPGLLSVFTALALLALHSNLKHENAELLFVRRVDAAKHTKGFDSIHAGHNFFTRLRIEHRLERAITPHSTHDDHCLMTRGHELNAFARLDQPNRIVSNSHLEGLAAIGGVRQHAPLQIQPLLDFF